MCKTIDVAIAESIKDELFKLCEDCSAIQNAKRWKVRLGTVCVGINRAQEYSSDDEYIRKLISDVMLVLKREMAQAVTVNKCERIEVTFTPNTEMKVYLDPYGPPSWDSGPLCGELRIDVVLELVQEQGRKVQK